MNSCQMAPSILIRHMAGQKRKYQEIGGRPVWIFGTKRDDGFETRFICPFCPHGEKHVFKLGEEEAFHASWLALISHIRRDHSALIP